MNQISENNYPFVRDVIAQSIIAGDGLKKEDGGEIVLSVKVRPDSPLWVDDNGYLCIRGDDGNYVQYNDFLQYKNKFNINAPLDYMQLCNQFIDVQCKVMEQQRLIEKMWKVIHFLEEDDDVREKQEREQEKRLSEAKRWLEPASNDSTGTASGEFISEA
jgi:hypothetical protein